MGWLMNILQKLTDLPVTHERFYEDFDKRYMNTFLLVDYKLKRDVLFLANREDGYLYFRGENDKTSKYTMLDDHLTLHPFLPQVGYYNTNLGPIYIQKNPQRQWKRSLCYPLYYITKLSGEEIPRRHYPSVVSYLYYDTYVSLDNLSVADTALNKHLAVRWNSPKTADLLYDMQKIANLNTTTKLIVDINPTFLQEIKDYLKYARITQWSM